MHQEETMQSRDERAAQLENLAQALKSASFLPPDDRRSLSRASTMERSCGSYDSTMSGYSRNSSVRSVIRGQVIPHHLQTMHEEEQGPSGTMMSNSSLLSSNFAFAGASSLEMPTPQASGMSFSLPMPSQHGDWEAPGGIQRPHMRSLEQRRDALAQIASLMPQTTSQIRTPPHDSPFDGPTPSTSLTEHSVLSRLALVLPHLQGQGSGLTRGSSQQLVDLAHVQEPPRGPHPDHLAGVQSMPLPQNTRPMSNLSQSPSGDSSCQDGSGHGFKPWPPQPRGPPPPLPPDRSWHGPPEGHHPPPPGAYAPVGHDGFLDNMGGGNKKIRGPRQQAQNRQAQQRFCERRRLKMERLEGEADNLRAQLGQLQTVTQQNIALQARVQEAERSAAERGSEVAELLQHLHPKREVPSVDDEDALKMILQSQMQLNVLLKQHQVVEGSPSGLDLLPEAADELGRLLEAACAAFSHVATSRSASQLLQQATGAGPQASWDAIIQVLNLSDTQRQQILLQRSALLAELRGLRQKRRDIILQALEPHSEAADPELSSSPGSDGLGSGSYATVAAQGWKLTAAFRVVEESLKAEKAAMERHALSLLLKTLSTSQAAILFTRAWHLHCDGLALANALAAATPRTARERAHQHSTSPRRPGSLPVLQEQG